MGKKNRKKVQMTSKREEELRDKLKEQEKIIAALIGEIDQKEEVKQNQKTALEQARLELAITSQMLERLKEKPNMTTVETQTASDEKTDDTSILDTMQGLLEFEERQELARQNLPEILSVIIWKQHYVVPLTYDSV